MSLVIDNKADAHAYVIAAFVRRRGAAYSGEILDEFGISEMTLRRRARRKRKRASRPVA